MNRWKKKKKLKKKKSVGQLESERVQQFQYRHGNRPETERRLVSRALLFSSVSSLCSFVHLIL